VISALEGCECSWALVWLALQVVLQAAISSTGVVCRESGGRGMGHDRTPVRAPPDRALPCCGVSDIRSARQPPGFGLTEKGS